MKLGDKIRLHIEREKLFDDKPDVTDGVFTVIGVKYGLPHCFNDDSWSGGFNSFEYAEDVDGRPDIVLRGSIYVPTPDYLDKDSVENMVCDRKTVSWELISPKDKDGE